MFEHSIRVPRLYKSAAKISKKVHDEGGSVKELVYQQKHCNIKGIYALAAETLQRLSQIDFLIKKSQLLDKEPRFDPWLARVLITELLWGKKSLGGESKPIKTVCAYEQILKAHINDTHEILRVAKVAKPRYVRVNTLKLSTLEVIDGFRDEGWTLFKFLDKNDYDGYLKQISDLRDQFMVDIHFKDLLVFPSNTQFYRHDAYKNGMIILQDKASCLPAHILNPHKGSIVLDMCAAPGMKTTQLAAMINNEGTVYAVERDQKRMQTLDKFVESTGATCVKTLNRDVLTITAKDIPGVEYILVDPSCSGSGITDRLETDNEKHGESKRLDKLAGFQIKILKHALKEFPDSKRIVYSTCSIYPQENEAVVKDIISQSMCFKLVKASDLLDGPWKNFGTTDYGDLGSYCIYAKPEEDLTNGFFVAVFERLQEGEVNVFYDADKKRGGRKKETENNRNDEENSTTNVTEEMSVCEDAVSKKKRKKKESVDDIICEESADNSDAVLKRKKKKGKKIDNENEPTSMNPNLISENNIMEYEDADVVTKKMKKKKYATQDEYDVDLKNTQNDDHINLSQVEDGTNKKKKKNKNKSEANNEFGIQNEAFDQNNECELPKKKKKHKYDNDVDVEVEKNHEKLDKDEPSKSKKKKTKKK